MCCFSSVKPFVGLLNCFNVAAPKKLPKYVPKSVEKPDYGKVPNYLRKFNETLKEKQSKVNIEGSKQEGLGSQPNTRRQDAL